MNNTVKTDIVIIGGGIAGLWLLNRLKALGYSVILLESKSLGAGQTGKSQGILHGGTKYLLQGLMTDAAQSVVDMPVIWKKCLEGTGEIDLREVPLLSKHQYLWSSNTIIGKIGGFLANVGLSSRVQSLKKENFPDFFQHSAFNGQVYELDEMVLDVQGLIRAFVRSHQDSIFKIDSLNTENIIFDNKNFLSEIKINDQHKSISIKAKKYIFAAGEGNESLLRNIKNNNAPMQRRPLHMVIAKKQFLPSLYAHCLGISSTPRITITTHPSHDNQTIWYLGGQLAEEGVDRDSQAQIKKAKEELKSLFPWMDFSDVQFATFFVNRAEGEQPHHKRPDSCVVREIENLIVVWPTKLVLAPKVSDEVIDILHKSNINPESGDLSALTGWSTPLIAKPIWDELL